MESSEPAPAITDAIRIAIQAVESDGRLTPDAVVAAASDPQSPLHNRFEWDDSKAAHQFRLEQARTLIRGVKMLVTTETRTLSTVCYVHDPAADGQGYVSVQQLRAEPENAREALRTEFARAASCLQRAEDLAEAFGMREVVAQASRKVASVRKRIERQPAAAAH